MPCISCETRGFEKTRGKKGGRSSIELHFKLHGSGSRWNSLADDDVLGYSLQRVFLAVNARVEQVLRSFFESCAGEHALLLPRQAVSPNALHVSKESHGVGDEHNVPLVDSQVLRVQDFLDFLDYRIARSEERRVGKEGRSRWSP